MRLVNLDLMKLDSRAHFPTHPRKCSPHEARLFRFFCDRGRPATFRHVQEWITQGLGSAFRRCARLGFDSDYGYAEVLSNLVFDKPRGRGLITSLWRRDCRRVTVIAHSSGPSYCRPTQYVLRPGCDVCFTASSEVRCRRYLRHVGNARGTCYCTCMYGAACSHTNQGT